MMSDPKKRSVGLLIIGFLVALIFSMSRCGTVPADVGITIRMGNQ
ncbi:MAG: hypothetical protein NT000_02215 [Proteobacteria bacterium]|nr:hypothetical protein [Pseudomonadota bacterium]